ncbi:type II toxin-antitoxin system RelN family antitoxin [Spirulina sp.]|uniref:type II toxin-antitoxin system RelN family antitoxin n=1 Tax=Spirulina sp. TaxID=1157 RepID=UPI003F71EF2B
MEALEVAAIVDAHGNLKLEKPLNLAAQRRVRVIVLLEDDPDDEPKTGVLDNLRQAWHEAKTGQTFPLSELWVEDESSE